MRLSDIISLAGDCVLLGIGAVILCTVLYVAIYEIWYRKIRGGTKVIPKRKLLWGAVFVCYLVVVLGATMLSRGDGMVTDRIQPPFYSYKLAWNHFAMREWRNIILNILMFVPFGFLLPAGMKKCRKFWVTYLAGLTFTIIIEGTQLVTQRGIFEIDDIIDNFWGAMIGYGIYEIVQFLVLVFRRKAKSVCRALAFQVPLFAAIVTFAAIFICYERQELGNIVSAYIYPYDKNLLEVTTTGTYASEETRQEVYQIPVYSKQETRQFAEKFFAQTGTQVDDTRTDLYDDTAVYYGKDGNTLWIDYAGGKYSYTNFGVLWSDSDEEKATIDDAEEKEIRIALAEYGVEVPETAQFQNEGDGNYTLEVHQEIVDGQMYDGTLSCTYYEGGEIGNINDNILVCQPYKEFPVWSEQEAYERICDGKFQYYGNEALSIQLKSVRIEYETDSKGFYQPVYCFEALVNNSSAELEIPALK